MRCHRGGVAEYVKNETLQPGGAATSKNEMSQRGAPKKHQKRRRHRVGASGWFIVEFLWLLSAPTLGLVEKLSTDESYHQC